MALLELALLDRLTVHCSLNWPLHCDCTELNCVEPPALWRFCVQIPFILRHLPLQVHCSLYSPFPDTALQRSFCAHYSILALGLGWDTWGHEHPILTLLTCQASCKVCAAGQYLGSECRRRPAPAGLVSTSYPTSKSRSASD